MPTGFDGFERGTYTWDPVTKAFTLTDAVDTNGDDGAAASPACRHDRHCSENYFHALTSPGGEASASRW